MSSVPQGSILGPLLFDGFIIDTDREIECTLSKTAEDTELTTANETPVAKGAIKRDLNRLEKWVHVSIVKFNNTGCKALHLGWGNLQRQYRLWDGWIESSPAKNLGLLINEKSYMIWQCALTDQKANGIVGCINRSQQFKGDLSPPLLS